MPTLVAIVLCGGKSSRMGQDKSFLETEGLSFLEHRIANLDSEHFRKIIISCSLAQLSLIDKIKHDAIEVEAITDQDTHQGAIPALKNILHNRSSFEEQYVLYPVDTPFYSDEGFDFFSQVPAHIRSDLVSVKDHVFPLWIKNTASVLKTINILIDQGSKSFNDLIDAVSHTLLVPDREKQFLFQNINTPEQYGTLRATTVKYEVQYGV